MLIGPGIASLTFWLFSMFIFISSTFIPSVGPDILFMSETQLLNTAHAITVQITS